MKDERNPSAKMTTQVAQRELTQSAIIAVASDGATQGRCQDTGAFREGTKRHFAMIAQTLFSFLVLILAVAVGLSLGFSVKPMVLRAWRAVGGREVG
jgi:hypothetical protein